QFIFFSLTINTDVLTASETLCLSSAAVPGLLSPRVNFLASGGAEAIAFHQTASLRHSGAAAPLLIVWDCPPPPTPTHSNLIPETSSPDKPANEAFPAALAVCRVELQ
ncbi:hypothetical protein FQN60_006590, partial [Etheostoma spectabile]